MRKGVVGSTGSTAPRIPRPRKNRPRTLYNHRRQPLTSNGGGNLKGFCSAMGSRRCGCRTALAPAPLGNVAKQAAVELRRQDEKRRDFAGQPHRFCYDLNQPRLPRLSAHPLRVEAAYPPPATPPPTGDLSMRSQLVLGMALLVGLAAVPVV